MITVVSLLCVPVCVCKPTSVILELFLCFFFSIKQRIPVGYTSNTEFSDVQEWGWLNPTGGAFSSVADLAKVA